MDTTRLYKEITRLAREGQAFPLLAVQRARQINALYAAIAALKRARYEPHHDPPGLS